MSLLYYIYLRILVICVRLWARMTGGTSASPNVVYSIPSRNPKRSIPVHVYQPTQRQPPGQVGPVLINFHRGGFVIPAHGSDDSFCRKVSERTGYTVIDVGYRLAPEHPFPAAHEDAEDAITWVRSQRETFDTSKVALSGFGAGGSIVLSLASVVYPPSAFHCAIAFYPTVDWTIDPGAKMAPNPHGPPISAWMMRLFKNAVFQGQVNLADPYVSPLCAAPERFPPRVMIVTADGDRLAPEGNELGRRLELKGGGRVIPLQVKRCSHAFDKTAQEGSPQKTEKRNAYFLAVDMLRSPL
ncbi:alpha/beta-hydrolase [Aspergillus steynii IBT 23096]|uniref:Alpha/beta-hydrolase n=1 Tax=Aspergillus steynii IBT 23096 TaxID=1392250 RepID=A0A2I2GQP3_9EURO|nr:alpha/beta-hydrolase [Aspergillus steynii IBT 23096]PLB55189.1 alpha/beta-hydrolase [Aspergillus steynii IBT 23096]